MNNSTDFTPDRAVFKKNWLPLEQAIHRVARFEHDFGKNHLALACHAALPSFLTPELVNLIRINFLETSVDWIAECDLLLSSLCQPINQGIFEIEPQIRQVLLIALQTHPDYGPRRLEEIAQFLYKYSETTLISKLPVHIKRTYQWISGAYIDPDTIIQTMFDVLKDIRADEFVSRMPDYLNIGKTLALIASPLEMTSLQVELEDLVNTIQLSTLYWTGDHENLWNMLQNTRGSDLDEITHALTKPMVSWLATSKFITNQESSSVSIPQGISATGNTVLTERKAVTIFCSYAHEDEELQKELATYLEPLQMQGSIIYWHDPMTSSTDVEEHRQAIDTYLNTAQIILLLISPYFLASDYCYDVEVKRAMERHEQGDARVIPILLRPVVWQEAPLGKLQPLPINAIPITQWDNRHLAFADVVNGIERVLEDLQGLQGSQERRADIEPIEVFLAYAHEDGSFLIELEEHLFPLHEQGLIKLWSDRQIFAGAERKQIIDMHLERASLILLLFSPHFFISDECGYEVQRAWQLRQANGIVVVPIFVRPCIWKDGPFADVHGLPNNGKPVTMWDDRDAAFADVVDGIKRAIKALQAQQSSPGASDVNDIQINARNLPEAFISQSVRGTISPIEIVSIFDYEDVSFLIEIENYLYPLSQRGVTTMWSKHQAEFGTNTEQEIDMHLRRASLILLFVSPHFLISLDCSDQTKRALELQQENRARVIPIIVHPCRWEATPFAYLQVLPTYSRPITSWSSRDAAIADVVGGIQRVIEDIEEPQTLPEIRNPMETGATTRPIEVFVADAHEDKAFLIELEKYLRFLSRQGLITPWSARQILPGAEWRQEIDMHLMRAPIILLLVSPHLLSSDYSSREMQKALERHEANEARVIPILVSPCAWKSTPFAQLPVLPTNSEPISEWNNQDEAFFDVMKGIKGVAEELASPARLASPFPPIAKKVETRTEASNNNPAESSSAEPLNTYRGPVAVSYEDFERFLRAQKYTYWSVDKAAIEQFMSGYGTVDELMQAIRISGNGSDWIYIFSEEDNQEEIAEDFDWDAIAKIRQEDLSHYVVTSRGMGEDFLYFDSSLDEASNGNPAILFPYEENDFDAPEEKEDSVTIYLTTIKESKI